MSDKPADMVPSHPGRRPAQLGVAVARHGGERVHGRIASAVPASWTESTVDPDKGHSRTRLRRVRDEAALWRRIEP